MRKFSREWNKNGIWEVHRNGTDYAQQREREQEWESVFGNGNEKAISAHLYFVYSLIIMFSDSHETHTDEY